MMLYKSGERPSKRAPAEWFTGTVWQDPIISAPEPARLNALCVTFEPGARTAWHTHPLGQTLHVVSGSGLIGFRDDDPKVISAGDSVFIPPHVEHWHGAGPQTTMSHIAMQEMEDGSAAIWLEHVEDADYLKPAS